MLWNLGFWASNSTVELSFLSNKQLAVPARCMAYWLSQLAMPRLMYRPNTHTLLHSMAVRHLIQSFYISMKETSLHITVQWCWFVFLWEAQMCVCFAGCLGELYSYWGLLHSLETYCITVFRMCVCLQGAL